ncbi:hypothetical protein KJ885_06005 [Patescibacteria group bacterium]|nr:hypothetical protein [Patescibacteria group bacterium]
MSKAQLYELVNSLRLPTDARVLAIRAVDELDEQPALLLLLDLKDRATKLADALETIENSLELTSSLKR